MTEPHKLVRLDLVLDYFGAALAEVGYVILEGQKQHGTTGWDRRLSPEHRASLLRHLLKHGTRDTDGMRHTAKVAWRALAMLQLECEADREPVDQG
jgi:hypothetical protein